LAEVEKKLNDEQVQYLRHCYVINKHPGLAKAKEIAEQWNVAGFYFTSIVMRWFYARRMSEPMVPIRRFEAPNAAA
ncbi:unnamed protein product, partial [Adineta steineri]